MALNNNADGESLGWYLRHFDELVRAKNYRTLDELKNDCFFESATTKKFQSGIPKLLNWWEGKGFWVLEDGVYRPNPQYGDGDFGVRLCKFLITNASETDYFCSRNEESLMQFLSILSASHDCSSISGKSLTWDQLQGVLRNGIPLRTDSLPDALQPSSHRDIKPNNESVNTVLNWAQLCGLVVPGLQKDEYFVDATGILKGFLSDIKARFPGQSILRAADFFQAIGECIPFLDNGNYRRVMDSVREPGTFKKTEQGYVSEPLSAAISRLRLSNSLKLSSNSDDANQVFVMRDNKSFQGYSTVEICI